jgi:hypothetical protein
MATQKQIAANRANARKSTGPRSVEGKSISSRNALKSGIDAQSQIIRGEDPAALQSLTEQYMRDFDPRSAAERALIDILIDCEWILRRLRKAEAQLWEQRFAAMIERHESRHEDEEEPEPFPEHELLGQAFDALDLCLSRLERRRDLVQRNYQRALKDLRELQSGRPQPDPPPDAPAIRSIQKEKPEIGFVSEIRAVPSPPNRNFWRPPSELPSGGSSCSPQV